MRNTGNRSDRNRLSWIYKRKKKLGKVTKKSTATENQDKNDKEKARIIVRNISFKATKEDVQKLYRPFGEILEINFPKRADDTPVGCCFVQFKRLEDASKAIVNTNKKEFLGRVINSSWAVSKSKYCEKLKQESEDLENSSERDAREAPEKDEDEEDTNTNLEEHQITIKPEKDPIKEESTLQRKKERRRLLKEQNRKKRARIVVRNLSFQVTEENLKEHFSQYGTIEEVTILKRSDGKNVGCAFVQFELVQSAAKAIHHANIQPLLDRPIVVDWALPKNKFSQNNSENTDQDEVKVKVEKEEDTEDADNVHQVNSNGESGGEEEKHDVITDNDVDSDKNSEVIEMDMKNSDEVLSEDEAEDEKEEKDVKRPRFESHDVSEGKTVFLKNVPFSVKNDELKEYMEQRFGPVHYALVCIDPLTEFSKGTAFVKFKTVEDAEKCLSAGNELEMDDQILEAHRALDRNEVENKANLKQRNKQKDNRNLYLVKEGVVLAGGPAAVGVSSADMAKRLQIEQWKSQILRNLNMFVSRTRLVVHNLPPTVDDVKLRKIFQRHCLPTAVIREARVMRDLKNVDIKGVGKSKEYGFVSFTTHEDALHALRTINNNPSIFTPKRRPIISFSIENRVMVNARQKRLEKSRENNPLWVGNKVKRKMENSNADVLAKKRLKNEADEANTKSYTGMIGKPGETKLRSKHNLKTQAVVHNQTVKKEKKKKKTSKKLDIKKKQKIADRKEVKVSTFKILLILSIF
ncbi:RNA-binding protein 28 [Ceratina calcarata]|uniref:RNA-binding protein 28 n=1 Tax=Ceratina calcarata TaxID=156304 RepID=A0AAJ7JH02_9HYME|nr:RNA-binding protein 28 [Ceratina calcarata]